MNRFRLDPVRADPFDLPEWLGTDQVTWRSESGLRTGHLVRGVLSGTGELACDLVAVDDAYPLPVLSDDLRVAVHRAWHDGQLELGSTEDRLLALVPGVRFDAELVMETLSRLARSVGASAEHWSVRLRIGEDRRRSTTR